MQVYDISVRFMRRIQLREYEPVEAEVSAKAQLSDSDDLKQSIAEAFQIASAGVHLALGLPENTTLKPKAGAKGKASQGEVNAAPATAAQTAAPAKPADDIPDATPAKTTAPAKPAAASSDIPDAGPAPTQAQQTAAPASQASSGAAITPQELSKWIGEQVRLGRVTPQDIMNLYPRFGVARFADIKPDRCAEAKQAIEELIAKNSKSTDL